MDKQALIQQVSQPLVEALGTTLNGLYDAIHADLNQHKAEEIDEALARYHSDGRPRDANDGVMQLDQRWWGKRCQAALEDWQPIMLRGVPKGQQPSDEQVKEAVNLFLGMTTFEPDDEERILTVQQECERASETDPHAIAIGNTIKHYVVGLGAQFSCPVPEVEEYLRAFWAQSQMHRRLKEAAARKFSCGEHFFIFEVARGSGRCIVRDKLRPWELEKILVHPEDNETRLVYGKLKRDEETRSLPGDDRDRYTWYADVRYFERKKTDGEWFHKADVDHRKLKETTLVQMCKYGPTSLIRGRPQLYPILRYLKYYQDFLLDRIVLNHERSKVIWIRKLSGSRQPGYERADYAPQGGVILNETDKVTWRTEAPNINAGDAAEDGRIIRLAIAAGVGMPEHIIFQDPSNNVYASLRKQDTPFSQAVRSHQEEWIWDMQEMFRTVKREGAYGTALDAEYAVPAYSLAAESALLRELVPMVQQGASRAEVAREAEKMAPALELTSRIMPTVDVPVDVDLPEVVQEDPTVQAKRAEILLRNQLVSQVTLSKELGYNYAEESRMQQELGGWPEPQGKAAYGEENAPAEGATP